MAETGVLTQPISRSTASPPARVQCTSISLLPARDRESWERIHEAPGGLNSPFLHPRYVEVASQVMRNVEVCLLREGEDAVAFLPFRRSALGIGRPVGSRLCDVSGALVRDAVDWDLQELTEAAGLRALHLSHVPPAEPFKRFQRRTAQAPFIDLTPGYEAYRTSLRRSSALLSNVERLGRKATREVGPVRFQWHSDDPRAFEALMAWKAAQRRATRTPDVLRMRWSIDMLQRIRRVKTAGFAGVLSALYFGDQLAAVHFGMRSREVLHYWIPAYNRDLHAYSPGLLLLMELVRAAAGRGLRRLDLGIGEEGYKLRAMNGSAELAEIVATRPGLLEATVRAAYGLCKWSRASPAGDFLRGAVRTARRAEYTLRSAWGN